MQPLWEAYFTEPFLAGQTICAYNGPAAVLVSFSSLPCCVEGCAQLIVSAGGGACANKQVVLYMDACVVLVEL